MPLPDGGKKQPWPPRAFKGYLEKIAEHQAWWGGDVKELRKFYGVDEVKTRERRKLRERMFHAQQSHDPLEQPMHLHVPIAGDLASVSANLLFSEPPRFAIPEAEEVSDPPDDDDQQGADRPQTNSDAVQAQDRLNQIVEETDLANVLLEAADMGSGLSGVFLRPAWDRELDPYPILTAIPAGNALPEFTFGRLRAVTFWWEVRHEDNKVYRRLERHEMASGKGLILHGLYEGDKDSLGRKIALTDLEETAPLADSLTDDGDEIRLDWLDRLLVQYVPNMKPYRRQPAKPWGRSDIDGVEPLMDALDETYTSWMNDIQLGIRRIIVDDSMLERAGQPAEQGTPAIFRTSQKVFSPLRMTPTEGIDPITIVDFAIRAADHQMTARDLIEQIVTSAGYAMQSLSPRFEGTADNASALRIRERKSFQTRDNKGRYWRRPLAECAELLLAIDKNELDGKAPILRPRIELSDSVAESILDLAQTAQALTTAEAASTETKVRMIHPDWSKEQVDSEVERIQGEGGRAVPDPIGAGDLP